MRFALIQMNPTIGDLDANAERLIDFAVRAREQGVSLAIAPELCVTGYPPKDLLDRPAFVRRASEVTNRIVDQIPDGLTLIFGTLGTPDDSVTDAQTTDARARLSNDAVIAQRFFRFREDALVEDHCCVVAGGASVADGIDKAEF